MSLSSLRRWIHRSTTASVEVVSAPDTLSPGSPEALFLQGLRYASGDGLPQDYAQAAACYTRAAEQDHSLAQLNLASLYERGQGVTRDQAKALVWLSRAAQLGNAAAQYRLGIHEHLACRTSQAGPAVENRIEALKWVQLAAAQGYGAANNACEFVALGMTHAEVAEGGRRAAAFVSGVSA